MTRTVRIRWINATAIVLAFFGFAFSPWLGSQSALGLLVELANFLRTSAPGADIGRQQAIFAILGGVLLCLLFQTLAFGMKVRGGKRSFVFQEVVFAVLALALLALLFLAFQAHTTGLFVTAVAVLVAALAALLEPTQDETPERTLPAQALPSAEPGTEPGVEPGDPMVDFQRRVAQAFQGARTSNKPFSLAMIGLPDFQEMTDAFGPEVAEEIFAQLVSIQDKLAPNSISTAFSSGAVMVALPDMAKSQAQALLAQAVEQMGRHGFPGEMLLPGGHVRVHHHVVSLPDDGDNLAQLTERVLEGYAEQ